MELLQLRYFFESAKNSNFAKTAEKFWVPASSVSASIKRLEEELGCQLFDRKSNRIVLNENGKHLQKTLCALFEELDRTAEELKNPIPPATEIRVLVYGRRNRMTDAIIEYQKRYPNVRFRAMFSQEDAKPEDFDLIVDKDNGAYPDYERWELCSNPLRFRAHKNSPLAGKELTMKDLRNERFVTMEEENMDSTLLAVCKKAGFYPNIVMLTNDSQCYERSAQAGLISLWKAYNEPLPDGLVDLNVTDFQERQTIYLYYKPNAINASIRNFIDFLKSVEF